MGRNPGSKPARHLWRVAAAVAALTAGGLHFPGLAPHSATAQQPRPEAGAPGLPGLPPVFGTWLDDTGKGAVEIVPCQGAPTQGALPSRLCGRIVWLKDPNDKAGRPLTDGYNPRAALRTRPICGLQVIGDAKPMLSGAWDQGWIYDPKEGKSYDVEVKLRAQDRLAVTGYLGVKFLSETFIWTRAPADLPRCDTTTQAAAPPAAATKQPARRQQARQ
jgi:uncharacterized protein (DUF2147 family)